MKKIGKYFLIGCVIAIIGIYFSEICGSIFNGMDYGNACILGMGLYLCIVVVTCTGIILSKITSKSNKDSSDKNDS